MLRRLGLHGYHLFKVFLLPKAMICIWVILILCFFCSATDSLAAPICLKGVPVDYGYESDKVGCIDVAASNLLNYLDRQKGNENLIPNARSLKDQQEDFHKKWDPKFKTKNGSRNDLKTGLDETFKERKFNADVKFFLTKDLKYETLLKEWKDDELIILLAREIDQGWGHALFLWCLESDKNKPRLAVTDPIYHPNIDHKINGKNTNSKGVSTWSNLIIGVDDKGFPDWRITLNQPEYTYKLGNLTETFDATKYNYRIITFASVSDVKPIPEPSTVLLLSSGLIGLIGIGRKKIKDR